MQINSYKYETHQEVIEALDKIAKPMASNHPFAAQVQAKVNEKVKRTWSNFFKSILTFGLGATAGVGAGAALVGTGVVSLALTPLNPLFIGLGVAAAVSVVGLGAIALISKHQKNVCAKREEKNLEVIRTALKDHKKYYDGEDSTKLLWKKFDFEAGFAHFNDPTYLNAEYKNGAQGYFDSLLRNTEKLSAESKALTQELRKHGAVIDFAWHEKIDEYHDLFKELRKQAMEYMNKLEDAGEQQETTLKSLEDVLKRLSRYEDEFFEMADRRFHCISLQIEAQEQYVAQLKAR